jgi:uncharacterized protein YndB with AHSA1/START domain
MLDRGGPAQAVVLPETLAGDAGRDRPAPRRPREFGVRRADNHGVYLDIVPGERLVFTDAFTEGFIPKDGAPFMTGFVQLADGPEGGTIMLWGARHWSAEDKARHEAMGFHEGWSAAAMQLDELARSLAAQAR